MLYYTLKPPIITVFSVSDLLSYTLNSGYFQVLFKANNSFCVGIDLIVLFKKKKNFLKIILIND